MRSGEDITDIISKRGITREEVNALNPEVNLDRLSGNPSSTPQGRPNIISTLSMSSCPRHSALQSRKCSMLAYANYGGRGPTLGKQLQTSASHRNARVEVHC